MFDIVSLSNLILIIITAVFLYINRKDVHSKKLFIVFVLIVILFVFSLFF